MTEIVAGIGERHAERRGDWICTASGQKFWPLDPRVGDYKMEDIAHSLSLMCRFNGHTKYFYSVAQHCVHVLQLVKMRLDAMNWRNRERHDAKRWALLHDATEAYLCDIPRPLKLSIVGYKEAEMRAEAVLCEQYGIELTDEIRTLVKWADNVMLFHEAHQLMPRESAQRWHWPAEVRADCPRVIVTPWTPSGAREIFLQCFREI